MPGPADLFLRWIAAKVTSGGLIILMYHRVLAAADEMSGDVTAAVFDAQLQGLKNHFTPLPLTEAIDRLRTRSIPRGAVCVTFDDGYLNNAEVALPLLQRYSIPATFFVTTAFLDGGIMWNDAVIEAIRATRDGSVDLRDWDLGQFSLDSPRTRRECATVLLNLLKYEPPAQRDARIRELADRVGASTSHKLMLEPEHVRVIRGAGMEIGAHSITHPILTRIGDEEARREISDSGRRLAEILREPVHLFAYPNGKPGRDYGPEHVAMVRDAGYKYALSTRSGVATASVDPYQVPRVAPWGTRPRRFTMRLLRNFVQHPVAAS